MQIVKGMVQVEGTTYRVTRVMPHLYEAVRILDNQVAGWFTSDLSVIAPHASDASTLRAVAHHAVKQGKTSWTGRASAPPRPAADPRHEPSDVSGVRLVDHDFVESLAAESLRARGTRKSR